MSRTSKWLLYALPALAALVALAIETRPFLAIAGPAGCNTSAQGVATSRTLANATEGEEILYSVTLSNVAGGNVACDYTDVTLTVDLPDGTAAHDDAGDLVTLATGLDVMSGESYTYSGLLDCVPDGVGPVYVFCAAALAYTTDASDVNGSPPKWTASTRAVGTVEFDAAPEPNVISTDAVNTNLVRPALSIAKVCSTDAGPVGVSEPMTFAIRVTNTSVGAVTVMAIEISDFMAGSLDDPATFDLAPGGSKDLTFTHIATVDDLDVNVINSATASSTTATAGGRSLPNVNVSVSDASEADSDCSASDSSSIAIIKTAGSALDGEVYELPLSGVVVYHYRVCNTGGSPLSDVTVNDDNGPLPDLDEIVVGSLVPGECAAIDSTEVTVSNAPRCGVSTHVNIAVIQGRTPGGSTVVDTDSAEVCRPPVESVPGRMTGGGSILTGGLKIRVTHGFELHCDHTDLPNNLQINWDKHRFHLRLLTFAICFMDTSVPGQPPSKADFNTYVGEGDGRLDGVNGARIEFTLVDSGEPGRADTWKFTIFDENGDVALRVNTATLTFGNLSALRK